MIDTPKGARAKRFGAYYTDRRIAEFIAAWAIRAPDETVVDPSFGGGVFLEAAVQRLTALGGSYREQIFGVELDETVHTQIAYELSLLYGLNPRHLLLSNFFDARKEDLAPLDAVVGNPPFIRYQSFRDSRDKAFRRASEQGVELNNLSSSWAPFLVHSCSLLKQGGRLGMVLPLELGHASYARPVLAYLTNQFERITLITFKERLFPDISQDTLLLLAENKGSAPGRLSLLDLSSTEALDPERDPQDLIGRAERIEPKPLIEGRANLAFFWLPAEARALYLSLAESPQTQRLGDVADVGIGYVTGANAYFHLNNQTLEQWRIPPNFLKPAVYKGKALRGLRFSQEDWKSAEAQGDAGYLLAIDPRARLPRAVRRYISYGEEQATQQAYKCRVRSPWYAVPHIRIPDALLTYMSGLRPQLLANEAGAVAPNTLHGVHLRPNLALTPSDLSLLWQSSLTSLSVELEGHALGGGMLKLEPSEARRVLVANPPQKERWAELAATVDRLLREGRGEEAADLADERILGEALGLEPSERSILREAARLLRNRRCRRSG